MGRKSAKEAILDAAERVIRRQGMASTTVEGVAAEAGVSKGGLFYHFASKKEMLLQLMERYEKKFLSARQEIYDSMPDDANRLLKATIIASINHPAKNRADLSNVLSLLDDVEMREKVSAMKVRVFNEICVGYDKPEKIALAMMAVDGMWVMDLFGGCIMAPGFQEKIIAELLRLIDSEAAASPGSANSSPESRGDGGMIPNPAIWRSPADSESGAYLAKGETSARVGEDG